MIDLMDLNSSRYREVVVRLISTSPSGGRASPTASGTAETERTYAALTYTSLALGSGTTTLEGPLIGEPQTLAGLPLAGVELVTMRWGRYQEYLAGFIEGERSFARFGQQLFDALSDGLRTLFSGRLPGPLRVWWCPEAPELEDLPWELVAYANPAARAVSSRNRIFFVRGLPPTSIVPLLPVAGPLRLGVIYDAERRPTNLLAALEGVGSDVQVIEMTGPPRSALSDAVKQGYELLHLVADGAVSLAYDGVLYLHDPKAPQLAASELSALLSGSRTAIISLSAPEGDDDFEWMVLRGRSVPSVFRAFAYFGSTSVPLPSVLAPLGPMRRDLERAYWQALYAGLGDTLAIDKAVLGTLNAIDQAMPVALFSRHAYGQLFRRSQVSTSGTWEDPASLAEQLEGSQAVSASLGRLVTRFPEVSASVDHMISGESARQERLQGELKPWLEVREEEQ